MTIPVIDHHPGTFTRGDERNHLLMEVVRCQDIVDAVGKILFYQHTTGLLFSYYNTSETDYQSIQPSQTSSRDRCNRSLITVRLAPAGFPDSYIPSDCREITLQDSLNMHMYLFTRELIQDNRQY